MGKVTFSAKDIIAAKQTGRSLTRQEIEWFVEASTQDLIPDYQLSALLMAVFFKGMDLKETRNLTAAMIKTGSVLTLSSVRAPKVDKHSTGGVGDKISLIVGPLVASLGVAVPMVSGRGLGHTGGTLDKLESIDGFRTALGAKEFEKTVRKIGISIIGQTDEIVPADRKFYAVRDVTSTIVCPPLIVSSILSKKVASGADAIIFDIKCGEGAFMKTVDEAGGLARLLCKVASQLGKQTSAVLTHMDEPLGHCVGNAIEVREAIDVLKGGWVDDLVEVSFALASEMLLLAGKAQNRGQAYTLLRSALLGGKALQKFRELVAAQGGDQGTVDSPGRLPQAKYTAKVRAPAAGYVSHVDALEVGRIAALLGAGRMTRDDAIDPGAGIEFLKKRGEEVSKGEIIAHLYAGEASRARQCARLLRRAIKLAWKRPESRPTVIGRVTSRGIEEISPP